jgi:hypothetical protein
MESPLSGRVRVVDEAALVAEADRRAAEYVASVAGRRAFPARDAVEALGAFDVPLADGPQDPGEVLRFLDETAGPAMTTSNGPRYFGFVVGATLPVAAAADRLVSAWDQCASSAVNSPGAAAIERAAGRLVLQALHLPAQAAVGFGTSATACAVACMSAARRELLARQGWDVDHAGVAGAPAVRVVVPETVHITVAKALRVLGFGSADIVRAPCDEHGRVDPPSSCPASTHARCWCCRPGRSTPVSSTSSSRWSSGHTGPAPGSTSTAPSACGHGRAARRGT